MRENSAAFAVITEWPRERRGADLDVVLADRPASPAELYVEFGEQMSLSFPERNDHRELL